MLYVMATTTRPATMKAIEKRYRDQVSELADFGDASTRVLVEAFGQVVTDLLRIEDEGWLPLQEAFADEAVKGMTLSSAKKVTTYLEKQTKVMGGLLGRGLRLKNNHVFGRGYTIKPADNSEPKAWITNIIEDEDNWNTVFSPTALKELNRILFTSGNLFLIYDSATKLFERLAIDVNIDNSLTYPENKSRLKYILRSYVKVDDISGKRETVKEWVPTLAWRNRLRASREQLPDELPRSAGAKTSWPVHKTAVIIEKRVNKDNGDTWGVPDSFGAAPWAVIYSTYLKDGAKLQNALAAISYLVKAKTELAAKSASAKLSGGRIAQAAVGGPETDIQQVPRAGAVNLYEGRPIQAQAAAAMDVSVTGLAADPGLGGSYASENALSQPEQLAALSRQEDFVDLFRQIFSAMGASSMRLDFRRLDRDPIHRVLQSLSLARTLGGINQTEYRTASLELLDLDATTTELPEPDEFVWSKKAILPSFLDDEDIDALNGKSSTEPEGGDAVPDQGKSGAVGSLDDDGNAARADDKAATEA